MRALWQDLRYGFRMLAKSPGFTAIAVLTLTLGIGANTAIFSVVRAVLLKPLPLPKPDQLVDLYETEVAPGNFPLSDQDFVDWRSQNHTFQDMSVYTGTETANVSGAGAALQATMIETQAHFFSLLGVAPQLGRTFAAGEDAKGRNLVAILSNGFWKSHFGGSRDVIGRSVQINSETYTVIGVMPVWFTAPAKADIWTPIDFTPEALRGRGSHYLAGLGRLKAGVTIVQAREDLGGIAGRLEKEFPKTNTKETAIVIPLHADLVGDAKTPLFTLFGAVGLVLLIACANFANLLLARSVTRRREMALRAAVGASRWRLVRQLLTESLILSLAGGAAGAILAYNLVGALISFESPQTQPPNPIELDLSVLFFCLAVSVGVGILFGLAPAFQASSVNLIEELKSRSTAGSRTGGRLVHLRDVLVAGEIALSLALLAGAGLLLRTFVNLRNVQLGVRTDHVLTGMVMVPEKNYKTFDQANGFATQFLEKLKNSPGIRDAAFNVLGPLSSGSNGYVSVDGQTDNGYSGPLVAFNQITPDYFRTMGIPLLAGRELNEEDEQSAADAWRKIIPLVVAQQDAEADKESAKYTLSADISKSMAEHFWPNQDPVGKIFRSGTQPVRVVGVVADTRNKGLRDAPMYASYLPIALNYGYGSFVLYASVLTSGPPESAEGLMRSALGSLDSTLALANVRTTPQMAAESMTDTSDEAALLGTLAGLALLLAAVGTYGVMSYVVGQRVNEIGIRVALGAQAADVLRMILRQGGTLILAGVGTGVLLAAVGTRLMRDLLFGVPPFDVATYVGVALLLAGIALMACAIPARRAMRVDPMVALRYE